MGRHVTTYENGQHTCSMCRAIKPVNSFSYRDRSRGRLQARCKECCSATFKAYRQANPDKFKEYKQQARPENRERRAELRRARKAAEPERTFQRYRKSYLKQKFGITPADYDAMLKAQGGTCAICGTLDPGRGSPYFHVDHCHATNVVRGLLCNSCNIALGHFKDDVQRLAAAIEYLGVG